MGDSRARLLAGVAVYAWLAAGGAAQADDHGEPARSKQAVHRFSTLFPAQDVRDRLATDRDIDGAIAWCRQNGVTKAYVESFRDGYRAPREGLGHARDRLRAAGLEVSGCVTTTRLGKPSTGWKGIACLTDRANQERLRGEFEFAAGLFDEIMIDDFWFTDCACPACDAARRAKTVTIGGDGVPRRGRHVGRLPRRADVAALAALRPGPAKRVNPRVRLIIKYPQWYDDFHERGYDVGRETAAFDRTWVGTETRDYADRQWGGTPEYQAYFLMRWLAGIGGEKCGGGWFDPYGTTPKTYVEQARQTVLGGAQESLLFCYGSLVRGNGPANVAALRDALPELLERPRRSARARRRAWPPTSPPTATQEGRRGCSTSWA